MIVQAIDAHHDRARVVCSDFIGGPAEQGEIR
jgi:hypothetical protein